MNVEYVFSCGWLIYSMSITASLLNQQGPNCVLGTGVYVIIFMIFDILAASLLLDIHRDDEEKFEEGWDKILL